MFALLCFVLAVLASPFKSKSRLEAENVVLRHQLNVLRRRVRGRGLADEQRSVVFRPALSMVPISPAGAHGRPPRDSGTLASHRLSSVLALEVTLAARAAAGRDGPPAFDPAD